MKTPRFGWLALGAFLTAGAALGQDCGDQGPASLPDARYVLIQNGTVKDVVTGLMWKQCVEGTGGIGCASGAPLNLGWREGSRRALGSRFAGFADWRLPDRHELLSLLQRRCHGLDIDGVIFPRTPASRFWSANPASYYPGSAWTIDFGNGDMGYGTERESAHVRLVRDAEACSPARPSTCFSHQDRLYEPHGGIEELEPGQEP
ncbi:DUF1566 domain-containing protein [Thiocystis violacea]|uniref:Lcl C-terminal domain-containing protein n=1 Tax=Thiocystis violacea TaxID=13725 RepID=UPI001907E39F|nr:DUF1566 domain-containing protein [Thiocystis violacea]MBK1716795.1 hypothetical protein [Thiocystis violacea]